MSNNKLCVDIKKQFKDFLLDIKFDMDKGTLGILGPSGCGKSLTLKSIAGIVTPDSGSIIVDNCTLFDSVRHINVKPQQRDVGYLFQNYALFPNMSVQENILLGAKSKHVAVNFDQLLDIFNLHGLEKKYPEQLSGGQKQRVALARIFAYNPNILLLDEPFSALDTHLKEKLQLNLGRFLSQFDGYSILVTHNRDEAYQLSDYLLVIDSGRAVDFGRVKDVFKKPSNIVSARLTGCKNISRIVKIDDYHVEAIDWQNITFQLEDYVADDIKAIGIRAHDFIPKNSIEDDINNYIPVVNYEINEMPFEWYLTLENGLWYKQEKHLKSANIMEIPKYLMIRPEDIIMLR